MNLTPMGNRVVIRPTENEKKTATGIIIPDTASKARPKTGKVVFVGRGLTDNKGKTVPMELKQGDNVIFTEWAGTEIMIDGEKHLIMKEDEVLAVE